MKLALAALAAIVGLLQSGPSAPSAGAPPVEARYSVPGPAAVTHEAIDGYELFFPTDLAAGAPHPILTWGNGSFATPAEYPALLHGLASWGFVVVAATTESAGSGDEMLAGARLLVAADADPASPFFDRLDPSRIGAIGHSQGAGGAMRAATLSDGLIASVATWALPSPFSVLVTGNEESHRYDPSLLTVPAFYLGGSEDFIAPSAALHDYYDRSPVPAAVAVLTGADHNAVQHDGGRTLGYLTAWFRFTLLDDPFAAGAFTGDAPELLANPAFQDQALKGFAAVGAAVPTTTATTVPAATTGAAPLPRTGGPIPVLAPLVVVLAAGVVRRRARWAP